MEIVKLQSEAQVMVMQARGLEVTDDISLAKANEFLLGCRILRKRIGEIFDPIIQSTHRAHQEALDQKKCVEKPLIEAESFVLPRIVTHKREREDGRLEALAKLQQEVEERRRQQEALLRAAAIAESRGSPQKATKFFEEAVAIDSKPLTSPPPPSVPVTKGTYTITRWKWRIADESLVPREFLVVDSIKVASEVNRLRGGTAIPGIEVYQEDSLGVRLK